MVRFVIRICWSEVRAPWPNLINRYWSSLDQVLFKFVVRIPVRKNHILLYLHFYRWFFLLIDTWDQQWIDDCIMIYRHYENRILFFTTWDLHSFQSTILSFWSVRHIVWLWFNSWIPVKSLNFRIFECCSQIRTWTWSGDSGPVIPTDMVRWLRSVIRILVRTRIW